MPGNSFGTLLRVTTFGESHGIAVGCVIDGCPPGLRLDRAALQAALARRRPGQSKLVTPRDEQDEVEICSGLEAESDRTLGTPICLLVRNQDQRSSSYADWWHIYRPSHADFGYDAKYGLRAWQGGGRSSARETIGRVAAGAVAEQALLQRFPALRIVAWVEQVHGIACPEDLDAAAVDRQTVDAHPTRCPHPATAAAMEEAILTAKKQGDSLGGVVRLQVQGLPPGLGEPVFQKLDALLAQAMLSLPACKGFTIGSGFAGATGLTGLQHNDHYRWHGDQMHTVSNRSGGSQGGISNGMPLDCRIAFKPTATVLKPQPSADDAGRNVDLQAKGRHDPCVLPRAVPIVEAMAALVLCDCWLQQRGQVGDPWPGLGGPLRSDPSD
ncbi:MAG: chorismate synthase [Planctomycetota bacterium]